MKIAKKLPEDTVWNWAGSGTLLEKYKENKYVNFIGFVSEKQKQILLKNCDIFALTSEMEGFCIPVAEALIYQKPVVVYDLPVFRDEYGLFLNYVPPFDTRYFVKVIKRTYNELNATLMLRERIANIVQDRYSPERIKKNLNHILKLLV